KALGATAIATCGPQNVEFVRSLGADRVIDYTREEFTHVADRFDTVFDAVAKSSFTSCGQILKPGGVYVSTLPSPSVIFSGPVQAVAGLFRPAKKGKFIFVNTVGADLEFLGQLADSGRLRSTVSRTFSLARAAEAQQASQEGHTRGKSSSRSDLLIRSRQSI